MTRQKKIQDIYEMQAISLSKEARENKETLSKANDLQLKLLRGEDLSESDWDTLERAQKLQSEMIEKLGGTKGKEAVKNFLFSNNNPRSYIE